MIFPAWTLSAAGIACGASVGALLRWRLGVWLNPPPPALPYGTLAANWLGCLLMGLLMHTLRHDMQRLVFLTGFLGSLTTLSAFSAETVESLLQGRWPQALLLFLLHGAGGILCCLAGWQLCRFVQTV